MASASLRLPPGAPDLARHDGRTDRTPQRSSLCCHPTYDVHPDGDRFLMIRRTGGAGELIVVQNFFRELEERVGN